MKNELESESNGHMGLASLVLGILGMFFIPIIFYILDSELNGHMGLASLVLRILGMFFIPIIFSILAMIFGGVAMNKKQRFGTTGLTLGIIGFITWGIVVSVLIFLVIEKVV